MFLSDVQPKNFGILQDIGIRFFSNFNVYISTLQLEDRDRICPRDAPPEPFCKNNLLTFHFVLIHFL